LNDVSTPLDGSVTFKRNLAVSYPPTLTAAVLVVATGNTVAAANMVKVVVIPLADVLALMMI
jgi:hypothetical protein